MGKHPHERNLSRRYSILQQVATGTSLIQRGIQEHRGQKKDAPAKGRRADNTLIGGVNVGHISSGQGRCQSRRSFTWLGGEINRVITYADIGYL